MKWDAGPQSYEQVVPMNIEDTGERRRLSDQAVEADKMVELVLTLAMEGALIVGDPKVISTVEAGIVHLRMIHKSIQAEIL